MKTLIAEPSQKHFSVVVIGGGQAGLSASYLFKERGIDHIIFEKNRLAESWRYEKMGHLLSGHAQLAVPITRPPLFRTRPAWIYGEG